jgi:hypothetical protein
MIVPYFPSTGVEYDMGQIEIFLLSYLYKIIFIYVLTLLIKIRFIHTLFLSVKINN